MVIQLRVIQMGLLAFVCTVTARHRSTSPRGAGARSPRQSVRAIDDEIVPFKPSDLRLVFKVHKPTSHALVSFQIECRGVYMGKMHREMILSIK